MKHWAFAVFAHQGETFSQMCAVLEAHNEFEASGHAHAIALKLFPPHEGWAVHNVCVAPADNVVSLDNVRLLPE